MVRRFTWGCSGFLLASYGAKVEQISQSLTALSRVVCNRRNPSHRLGTILDCVPAFTLHVNRPWAFGIPLLVSNTLLFVCCTQRAPSRLIFNSLRNCSLFIHLSLGVVACIVGTIVWDTNNTITGLVRRHVIGATGDSRLLPRSTSRMPSPKPKHSHPTSTTNGIPPLSDRSTIPRNNAMTML